MNDLKPFYKFMKKSQKNEIFGGIKVKNSKEEKRLKRGSLGAQRGGGVKNEAMEFQSNC